MALFDYLKSSLMSKVVMAVTGIILVLFVVGHCIGNMQVFIGQETFNRYAHFLQSLGELLWVIRIVLLLSLILHIITSIRLKLLNYKAKGQNYEVKRYVRSTLSGRTMIWTGLAIVIFLVYHLMHFTTGDINPENFSKNNPEYYHDDVVIVGNDVLDKDANVVAEKIDGTKDKCCDAMGVTAGSGKNNPIIVDGKTYYQDDDIILFHRPDAYSMMIKNFRIPLHAILYVLLVIIIGYHISHAIQSAFQTLGLNHPKYDKCFRSIGPVLSIIVVLCYISIPISIYLGLVGGGV